MNTLFMADKNLKNNLSFYSLYFLSVALVIAVLFAFTSFSVNSVMLEKISQDGRVEAMCGTISLFLMIFAVFYMSYSNKFFLKRRTKELGIYSLLGYKKTAILSLLTFENILVFCVAFFAGLPAGAVLHKSIVIGITALLGLTVDHAEIPLFHLGAAAKTAGFIFAVAIVIAAANGRLLLKTPLMELIRFEKKAEKNMKFRPLPAFLGLALTVAGFVLAADILRGDKSVWISFGFYSTGMLTMMLVITGNIFFITSFLPYVISQSKKNEKAFFTETKIITAPNFIYRVRSNAKTLIMLTLLSAATLTVSGVMALSVYYPIAAVSRMAPSEIEFRIGDDGRAEAVKQLVGRSVTGEEVSIIRTDIYRVSSTAKELPPEYGLGTAKGDAENEKLLRESGFECISYSNYTALLAAQGKGEKASRLPQLSDDECILVKYQPDQKSDIGSVYPLETAGGPVSVTVRDTTLDNPISFANSIATLIVSDRVMELIKTSSEPVTGVMSINGKAVRGNEDLYGEIDRILDGSPYLQGNSHRVRELFSLNSSTFLLIGFLVVLFFIAAGSILYFNNTASVSDSKSDYGILMKMGYTRSGIRKIIKRQVLASFGIPFLFGMADCVFAIMVYKTGLMQNLLGNSLVLYMPAFAACVVTALVYGIYYKLTVRSCCKQIFS